MTDSELSLWRYYLTLERDFVATTAFVEIDDHNYSAFSDRYAALMLLIGSEIDVMAKIICKLADPLSRPSKIFQYRNTIAKKYPWFYCARVYARQYGIQMMPWRYWSPTQDRSPPWWSAYNCVKHDRINERRVANQLNTLLALGGLYVLHAYHQWLLELTRPDSTIFTCRIVGFSCETPEKIWSSQCRDDVEPLP